MNPSLNTSRFSTEGHSLDAAVGLGNSKTNPDLHRKSFRDILRQSSRSAAAVAWKDAEFISQLRHAARGAGQIKAAAGFSQMKAKKVIRAFQICPDIVKAKKQMVRGHALLLIKFGRRGLHLPTRYAPYFGL